MGNAPKLTVTRAEDHHADLIAEFIRQVWDPDATGSSVIASRASGAEHNTAEPGVPPPTWIAIQHDKVLGYVTTLPIRIWDGHREWPAYWIKGLMVLPEFRGGPLGYLVMKAAAASLSRTGGLAVAQPARRLFEALGYRDFGAVPNWVRPLAPRRIINRIDLSQLGFSNLPRWTEPGLNFLRRSGVAGAGGWVAGGLIRILAAARRVLTRDLVTAPFVAATESDALDDLWLQVRGGFQSTVVRDGRYLLSRYDSGAASPYLWLAVRQSGALRGVVILRRPSLQGDSRLQGIRVATIADLMYSLDQPAAGLALLGAAEKEARKLGADAILAMSASPDLASLLHNQWYMPLSGNVHFLFRDVAGDGPAFGQALESWWLTRGDGQADQAF